MKLELRDTAKQQLDDLIRRIRRLGPDHRDPERFHIEKSEIAHELRRLTEDLR